MNDKARVIIIIVVFVALAAFPFWYALGAGDPADQPVLEMPENATQCVEDKTYMTANHMNLLNQWRDAVIRDGEKTYISNATGEQHSMSLTGTCLGCHINRDAFCTRCHDYANVEPTCWDCHVESKGN